MTEGQFKIIREREGDSYEFEYGGFDCFVLRHPTMFSLNGYLIISPISMSMTTIENFEFLSVHGGVTYEKFMNVNESNNRFLDSIESLNVGDYVVGFDCAHAGDMMPAMLGDSMFGGSLYRNKEYVISEIKGMVDQLNDIHPELNVPKVREESIDKLIE